MLVDRLDHLVLTVTDLERSITADTVQVGSADLCCVVHATYDA